MFNYTRLFSVIIFLAAMTSSAIAFRNTTYWIDRLNLQPDRSEGGFFKETFRSNRTVTRKDAYDAKSALTSIYYLLEGKDFSAFHQLLSDEIWYFHAGASLTIHMIDEAGNLTAAELSDTETGGLSFAVNAGLWYAAEIPSGTGYTLVSCAVAPGFDPTEFVLGKKQDPVMLTLFPQHATLWNRLTRE